MDLIKSAIAALTSAKELALTQQGQSAAAVLIVLLTWAVLTKRVFLVTLCAEDESRAEQGSEASSPQSSIVRESPASTRSDVSARPMSVVPQSASRRRAAGKEAQEGDALASSHSSSSARSVEGKSVLPSELHEAAGEPERDPTTGRLALREGAYWQEPDPLGFKVRGPSYLMDKMKVPCGDSVFKLLDCDLLEVPAHTNHLARHVKDRLSSLWAPLKEEGKEHFTFIVVLQVPGPPFKVYLMYLGCADKRLIFDCDTPFSRVARKFFAPVHSPGGPDGGGSGYANNDALHKFRNNTFKLIPRCVNAPFLVKRAVGEVPTLLGNKLNQLYFATEDYFEIDVNISSSRIAQYTVGLAINSASVVVCDLAFVLQGAAPEELPENLVGTVRIEHIVMKNSTPFLIPKD